MSKLSFHSICRYLVKDETYLSTVIDLTTDLQNKLQAGTTNNIMEDIVSEYVQLIPFEKQPYSNLPSFAKLFLTPDFHRIGIKTTLERNLSTINITFINSLNIMLRPELLNGSPDDQVKAYNLLEECVNKMIECNYQIDKQKNTKKIQAINKQHIKNLSEGRITKEIIQYVVNIFEINLVIFNLTKNETEFYFAHGIKYPYVNLFRDIYYMTLIHGNYEPVIVKSDISIDIKYQKILYAKLLQNTDKLISDIPIRFNPYHAGYLSDMKISSEVFDELLNKHFSIKYGEKLVSKKIKKKSVDIFSN